MSCQLSLVSNDLHAGGAFVTAVQLRCRPAVAGSRRPVMLPARCRAAPRSHRAATAACRRRCSLHPWRSGRPGPRVGVGHCRRLWDIHLGSEADHRATVITAALSTTNSKPAVVWHPPWGELAAATQQTETVYRTGLIGRLYMAKMYTCGASVSAVIKLFTSNDAVNTKHRHTDACVVWMALLTMSLITSDMRACVKIHTSALEVNNPSWTAGRFHNYTMIQYVYDSQYRTNKSMSSCVFCQFIIPRTRRTFSFFLGLVVALPRMALVMCSSTKLLWCGCCNL